MQLTISGYSTALFSTWYFIEELGLLFDAGDGVTSSLLQKSRKINQVFISHADRDHLTGLFQLNQLNARPGLPEIYFPQHCGSFPALENFTKLFDPHVGGTVWKPVTAGERVEIKKDIVVEALPNKHVDTKPGHIKSLSYKVVQVKSKLKAVFANLPGYEIKKLIEKEGKAYVTDEHEDILLSYSGDTPVDTFDKWNNSRILIHEATFLHKSEEVFKQAHGNRHSTLEEVMQMVKEINTGALILGHFSSRYSPEQIDDAIKTYYRSLQLKIPVYRVLPGQTTFNILQSTPLIGG